jgi:hypothetical protein
MISTKNRIISAIAALSVLVMTSGLPEAVAVPTPPAPPSINIIPNITSVALVNGVLTATGTATAVVHGHTVTVPFSAPVDVTASPNPDPNDPCAILNLRLGPINLNLLGLVVQTSPICLVLTGFPNGGLLGQLLCGLANGLNNGIPLVQYLQSLPPDQLNTLLAGIVDILNGSLANLYNAVLTSIDSICGHPGHHRACAILHLEIGPLDLTLLGLNIVLDDCDNGPVTVDITAVRGALLGNLLCGLLGHNLIDIGATLQDILNLIVARLH